VKGEELLTPDLRDSKAHQRQLDGQTSMFFGFSALLGRKSIARGVSPGDVPKHFEPRMGAELCRPIRGSGENSNPRGLRPWLLTFAHPGLDAALWKP